VPHFSRFLLGPFNVQPSQTPRVLQTMIPTCGAEESAWRTEVHSSESRPTRAGRCSRFVALEQFSRLCLQRTRKGVCERLVGAEDLDSRRIEARCFDHGFIPLLPLLPKTGEKWGTRRLLRFSHFPRTKSLKSSLPFESSGNSESHKEEGRIPKTEHTRRSDLSDGGRGSNSVDQCGGSSILPHCYCRYPFNTLVYT
jgi:hypothetical protein